MSIILKTEMLIYQSKPDLHEKILFGTITYDYDPTIDLLAILRKSLDRALVLYIFIHEFRSSGARVSITIVHIRKFYKM